MNNLKPFFNVIEEEEEDLISFEEEDYDFTEDLGINTTFIKEDLNSLLSEVDQAITDEEADLFIETYGEDIAEAMTETGWDLIRFFLKMFFEETKQIKIAL